jgi:hypothetical protein
VGVDQGEQPHVRCRTMRPCKSITLSGARAEKSRGQSIPEKCLSIMRPRAHVLLTRSIFQIIWSVARFVSLPRRLISPGFKITQVLEN